MIIYHLEYILPKSMIVSTNKIYAGSHWTKRKKYADYFHLIVLSDCKSLEPIHDKVDLSFVFSFNCRWFDSSNCTFMAKCLEDWIKKAWIIKDDSMSYVGKFTCESVKGTENKVNMFITTHYMKYTKEESENMLSFAREQYKLWEITEKQFEETYCKYFLFNK